MVIAQTLRPAGTFVPMGVHVGKVLRDLYVSSGLKMGHFTTGVPYSSKTIYYHFGQEHLSTETIENYEAGLRKLGIEVDIFGMISAQRRHEAISVGDPAVRYGRPDDDPRIHEVAELLRQAAEKLEGRQSPAQERERDPA